MRARCPGIPAPHPHIGAAPHRLTPGAARRARQLGALRRGAQRLLPEHPALRLGGRRRDPGFAHQQAAGEAAAHGASRRGAGRPPTTGGTGGTGGLLAPACLPPACTPVLRALAGGPSAVTPGAAAPPTGAQGVTLHALIDSCHSGTAMNLPYNALLSRGRFKGWEEEYPGKGWKMVSQGCAVGYCGLQPPLAAECMCFGLEAAAVGAVHACPCRQAGSLQQQLLTGLPIARTDVHRGGPRPAPLQSTAGGLAVQFSAARHDQLANEACMSGECLLSMPRWRGRWRGLVCRHPARTGGNVVLAGLRLAPPCTIPSRFHPTHSPTPPPPCHSRPPFEGQRGSHIRIRPSHPAAQGRVGLRDPVSAAGGGSAIASAACTRGEHAAAQRCRWRAPPLTPCPLAPLLPWQVRRAAECHV